jgi:hypothetical protein
MQGRGERDGVRSESEVRKTRKSRVRETERTGITWGLQQAKGGDDFDGHALVGEAELGLELKVGVGSDRHISDLFVYID